jgi:Tfp pilus assembly protein PilF
LYYKNLSNIYADKLTDKRSDFEKRAEKDLKGILHKDNIDFRTMLANYYGRIGNKEKQIFYFEQALNLDPSNEAIKNELEFLKQ